MKSLKKILIKLGLENIINIIGHLLTIISLILLFVTLLEMKIQRNNTYMPQVVAECNDAVKMSWDRMQDIISLSEEGININNKINLEVYNVGVGVARNLKFEWINDNIETLTNYINNNSSNFQTSLNNDLLNIKASGIEIGGGEVQRVNELNFLAPNSNKPYLINIPYQYLLCYKIMLIDQLNDYPPIQLKISYTDIQGKAYEQTLTLIIKPNILTSLSGNESEDFIGNAELEITIY
jgi:hypothetical protein